MWIVPRPLLTSLFAPGTEASTSDLNVLSAMSEQSLFVKSKPLLSRTWLRRWKAAAEGRSSLRLLYGRTLSHSLGQPFAEKWTSLVEGSLVSLSAEPGQERQTETQDTSSPISSKVSASWEDLPLFCLRTSKASSAPLSRETIGATLPARQFSTMSSESWRGWVTTQRQEYLAREKSAPPIYDAELSSWQPTSARQGAGSSVEGLRPTLESQEPCLRPQEGLSSTLGSRQELSSKVSTITQTAEYMRLGCSETASSRTPSQGPSKSCGSDYQPWATPTARDHLESAQKAPYPERKDGKSRLDLMPRQVLHQEGYAGVLNPRWVEVLMGLPIGWVQPSCTEVDYNEF